MLLCVEAALHTSIPLHDLGGSLLVIAGHFDEAIGPVFCLKSGEISSVGFRICKCSLGGGFDTLLAEGCRQQLIEPLRLVEDRLVARLELVFVFKLLKFLRLHHPLLDGLAGALLGAHVSLLLAL